LKNSSMTIWKKYQPFFHEFWVKLRICILFTTELLTSAILISRGTGHYGIILISAVFSHNFLSWDEIIEIANCIMVVVHFTENLNSASLSLFIEFIFTGMNIILLDISFDVLLWLFVWFIWMTVWYRWRKRRFSRSFRF